MPPEFAAPVMTVPVGTLPNRLRSVWKIEWCGYPTVKKSLLIYIYIAVSTHYRRVTDGRTDIFTNGIQ